MSTEVEDIVASLKKYGKNTMCPYCGWSLLEPGHKIEECEAVSIQMEEDTHKGE